MTYDVMINNCLSNYSWERGLTDDDSSNDKVIQRSSTFLSDEPFQEILIQ